MRGSPHVHCLLWGKNMPNLQLISQLYIEYIDNVTSANMPTEIENPNLHKLVKFQVHSHSKSCRKYNKDECRFGFGQYFCKHTNVSEPLPTNLPEFEKQAILTQRSNILFKVRNFIDRNLNPRKFNILDPSESNFTKVGSIDEIIHSLGINYQQYEHYLSLCHLHLNRNPKSCFVNKYFLRWSTCLGSKFGYSTSL